MGRERADLPVLRLTEVLSKRMKAEGGYLALARKIAEANDHDEKRAGAPQYPVDRRKLANIINGHMDVVFSVRELIALDAYLEQFDEGLAHRPILEKPDFLQAVGARGEVKVLLGAKLRRKHVDVSHYDAESMALIQRLATRSTSGVRFDLQNCLHHLDLKSAKESFKRPWHAHLADKGPSLVVIGSPRANHAAEALLGLMFSADPFAPPGDSEVERPFHFAWSTETDSDLTSCFALSGEQLERIDRRAGREVAAGTSWAFEMDGTVRLAQEPEGRARKKTYGVICAQRRPGGQIWLLCAGLTGTGTLAAARALRRLRATVPPSPRDKSSGVRWVPIEATVQLDTSLAAEGIPRVVSQKVLGGPFLWQPPE